MIFTYNKEHVGDVLMVIVKDSKGAKLDYERKGNVSRVSLRKMVKQLLGIFLKCQAWLQLKVLVKSLYLTKTLQH